MDVVVIGSGPNGLAAALTLARAGLEVQIMEAGTTPGGGARTQAWAAVGEEFPVDMCSAVHPLAVASPFFSAFDLPARGVELIHPEAAFAHPLSSRPLARHPLASRPLTAQPLGGGPGGGSGGPRRNRTSASRAPSSRAGVVFRDLDRTAESLGADAGPWRRLFEPYLRDPEALPRLLLGDRRELAGVSTRHSGALAHFAASTARLSLPPRVASLFRSELAPALLAGASAHSIAPAGSPAVTATGLFLTALAHTHGWPIPRGGSGSIAQAMLTDFLAHGGTLSLSEHVRSRTQLPPARAYVFDTSLWALADILDCASVNLRQRSWISRARRFPAGNAASRVDFVLEEDIPWAQPEVGLAGTVHLGGSAAEIAAAEHAVARGEHAPAPMTLLSDTAQVDPSRRRAGKRAIWTYAHVPRGSTVDQTEAVTAQIERYAPGFRELILASRSFTAMDLAAHNPNYRDGDIAAGAITSYRMAARPSLLKVPYRTPFAGVYLASAAAAPGPGVHGMAGWNAAKYVLRDVFSVTEMPSLAPGT